jgi:hypothetical protein
MDKESLYWICSTSAQTMAAFIGLLFTGISFMYNKIDSKVEKDPTSAEIYEVQKTEMFYSIIAILGFAVISIVIDIFYLSLIPTCKNKYFPVIILTINLYTIVQSVLLVYKMMRPNAMDRIVINLSKSFKIDKDSEVIPIGTFIKHYIELEKLIRVNSKMALDKTVLYGKTLSLHELVNILTYEKIISQDQNKRIIRIIKLRNLIFHGGNIKIEKKYDEDIHDIISSIKKRTDDNIEII